MKIKVSNIGVVSKAEIDIKGLTVLAGVNGSGKTVIAKSLYAIFFSLKDLPQKVEAEKKVFLDGIKLQFEVSAPFTDSPSLNFLTYPSHGSYKEETSLSWDFLNESFEKDPSKRKERQLLQLLLEKFNSIPDPDLEKRRVKREFSQFFGLQVNNLWTNEKGEIEVDIKGKKIAVHLPSEGETEGFGYEAEAKIKDIPIYISDPIAIIDRLSTERPLPLLPPLVGLEKEILDMIKSSSDNPQIDVNSAVLEQVLKPLLAQLEEMSRGSIRIEKGSIWFVQKRGGKEIRILPRNLSSGLKTLTLMKLLIERGILKPNGIIIFDEPETHLHPAWQVYLADFLVTLQKNYGLHMLISTHSPYFISALEAFSTKYKTIDETKFYFSEFVNEGVIFNDVTQDTSVIYRSLAEPFQEIENIHWQNKDERD